MLAFFIYVGSWLKFLTLFCFMDPNFHLGKKKKIQEKLQSIMESLQLCKMSALTIVPFLSCETVGMTLSWSSMGNPGPLQLSLDTICSFPLLGLFCSLNFAVQQSPPPIQCDVHSAIGTK